MNALGTMLGGAHDRDAAKSAPYRGWRVVVNRVIWRAFVFTVGTLVTWAEKVLPGRGYGLRLFSSTSRITNRLLGVRVEVIERSTLAPGQAYVLTPNHRSHIDITAAASAFPGARFAAKRELFAEPILGAAMRALGMISIDRDDPAAAKRALDEAAAKFGREVSLVIFPEGTRAPARCMLPFKSGAFVFAIQAQVPVVPVALHNTAQVMPAHGYLSIPGGRIVVELLEPISTAGLTLDDRHALKERVRTALLEALRVDDGGVAQRPDLGSFAGHAFGVRRTYVVPSSEGTTGARPPVASAETAPEEAAPALDRAAEPQPPGRAA
jgi:1-acyl-sn-glycerol-3-phosphate acyltransferase